MIKYIHNDCWLGWEHSILSASDQNKEKKQYFHFCKLKKMNIFFLFTCWTGWKSSCKSSWGWWCSSWRCCPLSPCPLGCWKTMVWIANLICPWISKNTAQILDYISATSGFFNKLWETPFILCCFSYIIYVFPSSGLLYLDYVNLCLA